MVKALVQTQAGRNAGIYCRGGRGAMANIQLRQGKRPLVGEPPRSLPMPPWC